MENASSGTSGGAGSGTEAGQVLAGRYRLGDVLGSGGMGRVWRARDEVLHRTVAIKELRAGLYAAEADRVVLHARTQKEARAAARINHPGVVTVHDVLEHDDRPWIVMEYVDGPSLADRLKETGSCDPQEAARIGLQVLAALRAAHGVGVLHRDVKPGNVMLAKDGRVLLTDFGIAAIEGDSTITRTGELVGSLDYLAPERIRGEDPGPASDLWALGATLYTAVEERSPFRRTSPISTMQAVVAEDPSPSYNAGALAPVIVALLRKEPDERPSAAETEQLLREARAGRRPRAAQEYVPTRQVSQEELQSSVPVPPTTPMPVREEGPGSGYGSRGEQQQYPHAYQHPSTGHTPPFAHTSPQGQMQQHTQQPPQHTQQQPPQHTQQQQQPQHTQPPPRGKRRGKVLLVVLATAVIGGGAVFGVLQWKNNDSSSTGGNQASTSAGQQGGDAPASGGDKGDDPADGKDKPKEDKPKEGEAPAGWHMVKGNGFSLPVPDGWKRVDPKPGQYDFTPDGGRHLIRINVDPSPDYSNPYDHLVRLEKNISTTLPQFRRVRLEQDTYRDRKSGVLEFTFREGGRAPGPRFAMDMLYIDETGPEYAMYVTGPAAERGVTKERFDVLTRGWSTTQ
ncbi:serine/threonine-protein kinase [Streptomyces sp. NPDC021093]|uniref:serine/threonine-protein kinase n=1 Tax=Streptomyces sp. NPDC021093 TaxID=3365112 RepID=UPI00379B0DC5